MFKVSQEMRLNTQAAASSASNSSGSGLEGNSPEEGSIFGRYQRTPDADAYPSELPRVYVAPELTDAGRVQLLHFPSGAVRVDSAVGFIIKRNGVKGNFEVRVEGPSGQPIHPVQQQQLDPERFQIDCQLAAGAGLYKVHIKCNSVTLPRSPFIIVAIAGIPESIEVPILDSDVSKIHSRGLGLTHISLVERNEFTVDCSQAGSNMLLVGVLGQRGPCEEVMVRHLGRNIHKVTYRVCDPGDYILVVKWGDQHIPGSPFNLSAE
ncbi:filamin-A isoform X2 [Drosophila ficusphila]|uniref:filamin-A isoform X2 n=1 Tax=Drosophila ficusphila TaxID=30025 RepID=UPI0007E5DBE7|nr:filamin-A isoform X2 [Drosophila ficusphila]